MSEANEATEVTETTESVEETVSLAEEPVAEQAEATEVEPITQGGLARRRVVRFQANALPPPSPGGRAFAASSESYPIIPGSEGPCRIAVTRNRH
jgi:hypothetical protein